MAGQQPRKTDMIAYTDHHVRRRAELNGKNGEEAARAYNERFHPEATSQAHEEAIARDEVFKREGPAAWPPYDLGGEMIHPANSVRRFVFSEGNGFMYPDTDNEIPGCIYQRHNGRSVQVLTPIGDHGALYHVRTLEVPEAEFLAYGDELSEIEAEA